MTTDLEKRFRIWYYFRRTFLLLTSLLLAFVIVRAVRHTQTFQPHPFQLSSKTSYGQVGDFSFTERSGKNVRNTDLLGKVWIANFIFTHCAGPCPLMSFHASQLQKDLKDKSNVKIVSFTVDPERDTPQVLTEYAAKYGADSEKWLFLTGDKTKIYELCQKDFKLGVAEVPLTQPEALEQPVIHSTKFVLVDPQGQIRGFYDSQDRADLNQLVKDAKKIS